MADVAVASSAASLDGYDWDNEVLQFTKEFQVDAATITIQVGDGAKMKTFEVGRALLANHLPALSHIREQSLSESLIALHDEPQDFEDFLWFIHADPLSLISYSKKCPAHERFRRALGIGFVANFYESRDIARWAIGELSSHMDTCVTPMLLPRLHQFSTACLHLSPALHQSVQAAWRSVIQMTPDPVAGLLSARELNDQYLQAHAYFCILGVSTDILAADYRLTTLDRIRLNLGSLNLRLYCTGCVAQLGKAAKCACPVQDTYNGRSLWDLFTRAEIGYSLADSTLDLSFLELPRSIEK